MPVVVRNQPETRVVPIPGLDGCTVTVREPTLPERINQWWDSSKPDGSVDMGRLGEYRLCVVVGWDGPLYLWKEAQGAASYDGPLASQTS